MAITKTVSADAIIKDPALIVTSSDSRAKYNENANTLQGITNNMKTVQAGESATGIAKKLGMTPEEFLKVNPNFGATGGKGDAYGLSGMIQPGMTYKISPDGTPVEVKETPVADPTKKEVGGAGEATDGTKTSESPLDPAIKKQYDDSIANLDQGVADAKATLDEARAGLSDSAGASGIVGMIMQKYDKLIEQMKEKNTMLLGSYEKNAARTGGLQFANEMTGNFMSYEMDRASRRVADLVLEQAQMVLKAEEAYKKGKVAEFQEAMTAYEKANEAKIGALNDLLTQTDKAVKTEEAKKKAEVDASKQSITDDIRLSTNIANTVAETIMSSGITDEAKIREYVDAMAEKTGITNSDILNSAVIKARQNTEKYDLSTARSKQLLNKGTGTGTSTKSGKGGGTDGGYKYAGDDITTYSEFLNKGGKGPDGMVYAGRGDDAYVDPGAYMVVYKDWIVNGGTPQGFVKKFPIKNVNPDSRDLLPEALNE